MQRILYSLSPTVYYINNIKRSCKGYYIHYCLLHMHTKSIILKDHAKDIVFMLLLQGPESSAPVKLNQGREGRNKVQRHIAHSA